MHQTFVYKNIITADENNEGYTIKLIALNALLFARNQKFI